MQGEVESAIIKKDYLREFPNLKIKDGVIKESDSQFRHHLSAKYGLLVCSFPGAVSVKIIQAMTDKLDLTILKT